MIFGVLSTCFAKIIKLYDSKACEVEQVIEHSNNSSVELALLTE